MSEPKKRRNRGPQKPVHVVGGIVPDRVYSLREFKEITGMTRQALSRATRRPEHPLIVRDSDPATILGKDYVAYVEHSPPREPRTRRVKPKG